MRTLVQVIWGLGMFGLGMGAVEDWGWTIDKAPLHIATVGVLLVALALQWRMVKKIKKEQIPH